MNREPDTAGDTPSDTAHNETHQHDPSTHADRRTDKGSDTHSDGHVDQHGDKHGDRHADKRREKDIEKPLERHVEKHGDKHGDKHAEKHSEKHAEKHSDKHHDKSERKRRRAVDAYTRLQRAATLTATAADAALAPFSLSASQLGVLETLQSRGPLHQQELARTLGRSKAQMTAIIDALEKRGAASRERHATDRRFTTVHLTSQGSELLAEVGPIRMQAVVEVMGALSGKQRERLARLCRDIVKALAPDEDARDNGDDDAESHDDDDGGQLPDDHADPVIAQ